jgi:cholesterol oxidase
MNGWPSGYSRELLDPYFDLVGGMLGTAPITSRQAPLPLKTRRMREAAERLDRREQFFYPDLAVSFREAGVRFVNRFGVPQAGCTGCGECNQGCNLGAKNTLDLNYLALAVQNGAELRTESEVVEIAPAQSGYRVDFLDHRRSDATRNATRKSSAHATAVFLCAGTLGSTELLLRCRDQKRTRPGQGWTQQLTRGVQAALGLAGSISESRQAPHDATGSEVAVFLAMGRDRANGRLLLASGGRLRIAWPVKEHLPFYDAMERVITDLVGVLDGKLTLNPLWRLLRNPITVHSLGGCCMANDPAHGVTDPFGQVYGYENLFVLDGSILPAATGVNPAFTIAAVAERNVEQYIRRHLGDPSWRAPEAASTGAMTDPLARLSLRMGDAPQPRTPPVGVRFSEVLRGELHLSSRQLQDQAGSPSSNVFDNSEFSR